MFFLAFSPKVCTISTVKTQPHSLRGASLGEIISAIVAECQPEPAPTSKTFWPTSNWRASFIIETMYRLAQREAETMWRRDCLTKTNRKRRVHRTVRFHVERQKLGARQRAHRLNHVGRAQHPLLYQAVNEFFPVCLFQLQAPREISRAVTF